MCNHIFNLPVAEEATVLDYAHDATVIVKGRKWSLSNHVIAPKLTIKYLPVMIVIRNSCSMLATKAIERKSGLGTEIMQAWTENYAGPPFLPFFY